jgi:asparagine synthase (glutamine-hydrolysing)
MCGICGSSRDPGGASARAMLTAMAHRGPDDESVHLDGARGLSLGCRRLSIIDVAGGRQPLSNEDGSVWAALNGEIYNFPALRRLLEGSGHRFASGTDTEVLVHLYEEYGDALVHALEGMFAFAVWDERRGRLLLARDRFGEKPLFYSETAGVFAFASELTALHAGRADDGELDEAAVDAFFIHGYVPGPGSILKGSRQLQAGHLLTWDAATGTTRVSPYWEPPRHEEGRTKHTDDPVSELGRILEASVESRLLSDVPVGVLLSGGIDSSLIAAIMARVADAPVPAFTVGYDVGEGTEVGAARAAARALGAEHHILTLSRTDIAERVPRVLARLDQPLADQALVPLEALCEFARSHVTVLVGGEGADELFGGYPRYRWLERSDRIADALPIGLRRSGAALLGMVEGGDRRRRITDVLDPKTTIARHVDWVTDRRPGTRAAVYGPRLAPLVADRGVLAAMRAATGSDHDGRLDAGTMMILDQRVWLPDNVLAKADRAGMLASVETRTPYLHREVAEFAASVPASVHIAGRGKGLLRALLGRLAPSTSPRRRKAAFEAPAAEWLRGPLAGVLRQQVEGGSLIREGWFSADGLRPLAAEHASGARDHSRILWPVLTLGIWLDAFREGRENRP